MVETIVRDTSDRWMIENDNNNGLEINGIHSNSFGHGEQFGASSHPCLNVLTCLRVI